MKRLAVVGLVFLLGSAPLWADIMVRNAQATILYQYSNGTMYEGPASKGKVIFRYDPRTTQIRTRDNRTVLATWKGNALFPKALTGGQPLYVLAGTKIHAKTTGTPPVGYIEGRKIYKGTGGNRKLILYPDSMLPEPVALYIFHVAAAAAPKTYEFYLGAPKTGKVAFSVRSGKVYLGTELKNPVYTYREQKFYKGDEYKQPAFVMDAAFNLYRGARPDPDQLAMSMKQFNCYAPGKSGADAIGRFLFTGPVLLTEGFTPPAEKPDLAVKRALLSATPAPDSKLPLEVRLFLVYLTQLDPEFRQALDARK